MHIAINTLPNTTLIALAKGGNGEAFAELVRRPRSICLNVAYSILRNRADAEDEVQNAIVKAYDRIKLFEGNSAFATWLVRIVINNCLMRHRRGKRLTFFSYDAAMADNWVPEYEQLSEVSPEDQVSNAEIAQILRYEVRRLPSLLRAPLNMYFFQNLRLDEISENLGISRAAAKSRIHRGQVYLRNRMLRHCSGQAQRVGVSVGLRNERALRSLVMQFKSN